MLFESLAYGNRPTLLDFPARGLPLFDPCPPELLPFPIAYSHELTPVLLGVHG